LRARSLLTLGFVLAVLLPPSLTSFLVGALSSSLTGVYLTFYDASSVNPSMLLFIILYLSFEGAIVLMLVRQGSSRIGWTLMTFTLVNLLLGIAQYQSTLL
jgi:hypothetical protein